MIIFVVIGGIFRCVYVCVWQDLIKNIKEVLDIINQNTYQEHKEKDKFADV